MQSKNGFTAAVGSVDRASHLWLKKKKSILLKYSVMLNITDHQVLKGKNTVSLWLLLHSHS